MKYLISEVEFYEPTIEDFVGKVVVVRRDQLEGEKIYIAPAGLMNVAASFDKSENSIEFPNFADVVLFLHVTQCSYTFDTSSEILKVVSDSEPIRIQYIKDAYLMEVEDFGATERSIYDFLSSFDKVYVATVNPKTLIVEESEEPRNVEVKKEKSAPEVSNASKDNIPDAQTTIDERVFEDEENEILENADTEVSSSDNKESK